jgi:hypothetical protein
MDVNHDFVVLVPVGPGSEEVMRTHDLLDSLWFYESRTPCVLIDDSPESRELKHIGAANSQKGPVVSLVNPRNTRGNGALAGC